MTLPENKKIFTSSYQQYTSECLNSLQTHSLQPNLTKKWGIASLSLYGAVVLKQPGPIPNRYRPRIEAILRPYRPPLRAMRSRARLSQVNINCGHIDHQVASLKSATPPDVVSQVTLGIPLYLLFELGIMLRWLSERRKKNAG